MAESESRVEDILDATLNGEPYDDAPQSRIEKQLIDLKAAIEEGGGGDIIDDSETSSDKTWSSSKINDAISGISGGLNFEVATHNAGSIKNIEYENYIIAVTGASTVMTFANAEEIHTYGSWSGYSVTKVAGTEMSNAIRINNNTGRQAVICYIRG